MYDLLIRGAVVVDGLGREPRRADVAVKNSRIAAIGDLGDDAAQTIDAGGLALMPGIIDIHTHYDAQITWDPTLSPSPALASRPRSSGIAASASSRARRGCAI